MEKEYLEGLPDKNSTFVASSFFQAGKALGGNALAQLANARYQDKDLLQFDPIAVTSYTKEVWMDLGGFFTVAAIDEVLPENSKNYYKNAVGIAAMSARLYQGLDIDTIVGNFGGFVTGFYLTENVIEPIFGEAETPNIDDSSFLGICKMAYIFYSVDSAVAGVKAITTNSIPNIHPSFQPLQQGFVKTLIDPALFNFLFNYGGYADEDKLLDNFVLNMLGITMQVIAEAGNDFNSIQNLWLNGVVKQLGISTGFVAMALVAEYGVKPIAQNLVDTISAASVYVSEMSQNLADTTNTVSEYIFGYEEAEVAGHNSEL